MYIEETTKLKNFSHLKRSLEEAEILKSGIKLVMMNPSLDSDGKGEYKKAYTKLNNEIRYLRIALDIVRKRSHSRETKSPILPK